MDGLRFTCQPGCINCCDQSGFVYLNEDDLKRAARFVKMSAKAFEEKYVYRTTHQMRFRKPPDKQCPFLEDHGCSIHPVEADPVPHVPLLAGISRTTSRLEPYRKILPRHRQRSAHPNRNRNGISRRAAPSLPR